MSSDSKNVAFFVTNDSHKLPCRLVASSPNKGSVIKWSGVPKCHATCQASDLRDGQKVETLF